MKNILFIALSFIVTMAAIHPVMGGGPGETDPLNGERKVAVGVRFKVVQTGNYAGQFIGGIAEATSPSSDLTKWEIGICGGNLITIMKDSDKKRKLYWYVDPDFQGYKVGVRARLDSLCYFEVIKLKNGNVALKSHVKNGKYVSIVFDKSLKINIFDAVRSEVDESCEMQIVPYRYVTLGEPQHWYTTDIRPILLLDEPPKHLDYTLNADGEPEELNVSRISGFYSSFKDIAEKEISSSNTSTTDANFGVKVDAGTDSDKGIPIAGGVKANVSASAGYLYNNHKEDIEKSYKTVSTQEQLKAVNSDFLVFNKSVIHIWSYPILEETNVETTDGKRGQLYYQVVVPEPDADNPHYLSGDVAEWYQPAHQNGNVFSYPWSQEQIRKFEKTDTLNLLSNPKSIATDNNEMSFYVEWNEATEKGKNVSTSHKLDTDESIGVSFLVKSVSVSPVVKTNFDKTWESLVTSNTKLTQSKGITVFKEPLVGASSYAYEVHPLIFTKSGGRTKDGGVQMPTGCIKLSYLVKFPDDYISHAWWEKNYGSKPDIALNLPFQWRMIDASGNSWKFDPKNINFFLMKGLFVEDSLVKRFFYTTYAGETVTVKFRVYNFSFCKTHNVPVRLEAQESTNGKDWGERFFVGVDTIPTLQAFGNYDSHNNWEYASVKFDTKGRGGKYYRFWAVVNPDNRIEEVAEHGYQQKYGNNEGFFPIPLTVVANSVENLKVGEDDFSTGYTATISPIEFSNVNPTQGETVSLATWVSVSGRDDQPVIVYFYENRPGEKRALFDMEVVPFIRDGGKYYVQVPYPTLGKKGPMEITAEVQSQESVATLQGTLNVN